MSNCSTTVFTSQNLTLKMLSAVGKGSEGTTEPGNALADSQKHMNAALGPPPQLADGIMDLCSSPDASPAPKVSGHPLSSLRTSPSLLNFLEVQLVGCAVSFIL